MADLVVIVPSRGRPEAAVALATHFGNTCAASTKLLFAVDETDPKGAEYSAATSVLPPGHRVEVNVVRCPSKTMVKALNMAAANECMPDNPEAFPPPFAIGFLGDDHCPRTHGWDATYLEMLRGGVSIVYGNDLLQGERLPTQVAMTSDIVRALGYMAPPELTHLFVDNFWLDLGRNIPGGIAYLPHVVIEHRHPVAGKANWDEGYARVNDAGMYAADGAAYAAYAATRFADDVQKVKAIHD